jgi:hypothetical protein
VPARGWCEAQTDEARPFDDDPLIDRMDHVGLLLYEIDRLPGFG